MCTHIIGTSLSHLVKEPSPQRQYFYLHTKQILKALLPRFTIHAANWVTWPSISCRIPWSFPMHAPILPPVNLENIQPGNPVSIPEHSSYSSQETGTADLPWKPSLFLFCNFIQWEQRCAQFCVLSLSRSITSARLSCALQVSVVCASAIEWCPTGSVGHWAETDGHTHKHMRVWASVGREVRTVITLPCIHVTTHTCLECNRKILDFWLRE